MLKKFKWISSEDLVSHKLPDSVPLQPKPSLQHEHAVHAIIYQHSETWAWRLIGCSCSKWQTAWSRRILSPYKSKQHFSLSLIYALFKGQYEAFWKPKPCASWEVYFTHTAVLNTWLRCCPCKTNTVWQQHYHVVTTRLSSSEGLYLWLQQPKAFYLVCISPHCWVAEGENGSEFVK